MEYLHIHLVLVIGLRPTIDPPKVSGIAADIAGQSANETRDSNRGIGSAVGNVFGNTCTCGFCRFPASPPISLFSLAPPIAPRLHVSVQLHLESLLKAIVLASIIICLIVPDRIHPEPRFFNIAMSNAR